MAKSQSPPKTKSADRPPLPPTPRASDAPAVPEYTVVARRYRPQQFADLIGQEHVANALTNAITSGRIAHAYLFTGARGVGKTSAARILAKALNCTSGPTPTPCDACDSCLSVATGDDVDVLEIDGASNNKVDEIRDLRNNVGFRPTRSRYKIYIIDEVHMLSTSACNALLKTLEEPPPHVKFIFATTEVQKIPITILSRCQRFDFAHVGTQSIFETLRHIVKKEGLKADDDALEIIARRAAGSMRDSQSLLDQLLAFSAGDLTAATVHELFGTATDDRVAMLSRAILQHDSALALTTVEEFASRGLQLGELLEQLIETWRGMMLVQSAGADFKGLGGTPSSRKSIIELSKGMSLDLILTGLDVLTTAKTRLRTSTHTQVIVEMTVVRLCRLAEWVSVAAIGSGAVATKAAPIQAATPKAIAEKKKPEPARNATVGGLIDATNLDAVLRGLIDEVGPIRAAHLRNATNTAIFGPNALAIQFTSDYSSSYTHCLDERTLDTLRMALKKLTGKEWTIRVELQAVPATKATDPAAPATRANTTATRRNELLQLPMFQAISEKLGGQLVNAPDADYGRIAIVPTTDDDETEPAPLDTEE